MGESSNPNARSTTQILLRTGLLFQLFWIPAAVLDVCSTELARRNGDFVELNPTGFVPLHEAIRREIGMDLFAMAIVLVGAYFRRDALRAAAGSSLNEFGEALFSRNMWAVPLLGIPFFVAVGRYVVVISNFCYLALGWSPIDAVLLVPLQRLFGDDALGYIMSNLIGVIVMWYPVTRLIVRALYAVHSYPSPPAPLPQGERGDRNAE